MIIDFLLARSRKSPRGAEGGEEKARYSQGLDDGIYKNKATGTGAGVAETNHLTGKIVGFNALLDGPFLVNSNSASNIAPRLLKISWANEIVNLQGVFYRQDAEDFSLNVNDNAIAINARFVHARKNPSAPPNPRIGPVKQ